MTPNIFVSASEKLPGIEHSETCTNLKSAIIWVIVPKICTTPP